MNVRNFNNRTPLHDAAITGITQTNTSSKFKNFYVRIRYIFNLLDQIEVARLLHSYGAVLDAKNNDEWTPLFEACKRGNEAIMRLILNSFSWLHRNN